jgi:hypothetical protein
MNFIRIGTILLVFLLWDSSTSLSSEIYKWTDDKGAVHFTDDVTQVPEKYRTTIQRRGLTEEKMDKKDSKEPLKKPEDPYRDRLGRGEEYWRGQVEHWKQTLKTSQERVEALRVKYNELTEKYNLSKSSVERANLRRERDQIKNEMDQHRMQIEEAKNKLEKKIPEEAELYKAKPEWIK